MNLIRYDFSEPQAGKDTCDRKTAPMKAHIRRFVNENNDVTTAEDMRKALESHGGLRGCRVSVVEIDPSKDLHEANKIPVISVCYTTSSSKIAEYEYGKPITLEKVNFLSTKICKSNHKISQAWLSSSRLDLARKNVAS